MEVESPSRPHNPGPPWGFKVIRFWDKILPYPLDRWIKYIGALFAMLCMPAQRKHSRNYLSIVLGKQASFFNVWAHFGAFTIYLCDRVKAAFKEPIYFDWVEGNGEDFMKLINQDEAALLGTFHVGYSDLMGFFTEVFQKKIHMLRLRLENSEDTQRLESMAGDFLKIIWVNKVEDTLYALRDVIEEGGSVAMQCDRVQHASKLESFDFLGEKTAFPVFNLLAFDSFQNSGHLCYRCQAPKKGSDSSDQLTRFLSRQSNQARKLRSSQIPFSVCFGAIRRAFARRSLHLV